MRTWYRNLDYVSILLWVGLVCVGLVALYSSTHGQASEYLLDSVRQNFNRQSLFAVICAIGICIATLLRFENRIATRRPKNRIRRDQIPIWV